MARGRPKKEVPEGAPKSRTKREKSASIAVMDEAIETVVKDPVSSMPLTSYREYMNYNKAAREANHRYGFCKYEVKPCPEELHPKQRVVFSRNDQPSNPLPVYVRNHQIDFKKTLVPGKTYDLPNCICEYLSKKGVPVWKWFDNPDGSRETRKANMEPRFSLRTVYQEDEV